MIVKTKTFGEYLLNDSYRYVLEGYYRDAKEILGERMQLFVLTSSCGLDQCIPGWSDIDVLIVADLLDFETLRKLHSAQSKYQVKIALALLSCYELNNKMFDDKTNVVFYQLKESMLCINYISDTSTVIPEVTLSDIQADDLRMMPMYLHKLRRALYGSVTDKRQVIKMLYIVIKMCLRSKGHEIIAKSYKEAFSQFAEEFREEDFDIVAEMTSGIIASSEFISYARRVVERICNGEI